jgi:hypothetical protein
MIHPIPVNYLSSLWKREAGRDFWEGRFKPRNCYDFYNFLSNRKAKSQVKKPVSALRTPERQGKTKAPSQYHTRVLAKKRHCPYDLIRDLVGKEGSGRGDLSLCRLKPADPA